MSPRKIASEHPKGLMIEEYKSLLERITWHSVGIVNLLAQVSYEDRRMPDALGSGTLCTWNGHHLILTAKHVVEKTPTDKLEFLLRVDDAINWEGSRQQEKVTQRARCQSRELSVAKNTISRPSCFVRESLSGIACSSANCRSNSGQGER